ncbi:MAG: reductive dehalogenase [Proteobacteria bacterium]|nr:reductive dehalogenase [Pseudomonadota bacterium]
MNQVENVSPEQIKKDDSIVFKDQKKRYPWWVRSVDNITTEMNDSRIKKPGDPKTAVSKDKPKKKREKPSWEEVTGHVVKGIKENIPGRTLPDLALHYSAATYMHYTVGSLGDPRVNILPGIGEIQNTWKLHPPQSLGLPAWEASPEKAAEIVEAAGIQLGAAMIGITTINPKWLNPGVVIDAGVDQITSDGKNTLIPERMKYVICNLGVCPPNLVDRNLTELGAAGDRAGYEMTFMTYTRMMRFIKGLGYDAMDLQVVAPVIPFAITAGLGELGRMNRMVNPIFGGNVRLGGVLTDLPLAVDRPIDFGLQKFCQKCKKCATSCPANALSESEQPYWETADPRQIPGKKTYFENNKACLGWQSYKDVYCSNCMSVCPWSKQDKTSLHEMAHIAASKMPALGKLWVKLDDLFGYGRITNGKAIDKWWDLDNPTRGVNSNQGRKL